MPERDDDDLWTSFSSTSLPSAEWTHRGHLRVAWLFLQRYALDEAHLLMRVGIVRLNAFHGLVETKDRGYHETITRVWLALVGGFANASPSFASSSEFVDAHPEALAKDAPLRHYSRELLFSLRARTIFVEPDLAPLPPHVVW